MRLYAISDLHLNHQANRDALDALPSHAEDWLIVAGDVGDKAADLELGLDTLGERFARLIWVPGNHDLWSEPARDSDEPRTLRGLEKYERLVAICRQRGVITPEDPYPLWTGEGGPHRIAPIFLLYDYSFRPDAVTLDNAISWSADKGVVCADEMYLRPDPYASRIEWCHARCAATEARLQEAHGAGDPLVIVSHWPLRRDLAVLPRIPSFSIWCGTRRSEDWHLRFGATAVVYGHLHIRGTRLRDGVRCEEVSLGYPGQWATERGIEPYLRRIL